MFTGLGATAMRRQASRMRPPSRANNRRTRRIDRSLFPPSPPPPPSPPRPPFGRYFLAVFRSFGRIVVDVADRDRLLSIDINIFFYPCRAWALIPIAMAPDE